MCGRYASSRSPDDLVEEFEVVETRIAAPLAADYNVAPTKEVYAVVERPPSRDSGQDRTQPPQRQLRVLTWGLVPSWAKEISVGARMFNARSETAAEKPSFRAAVKKRRCAIPANGYYEWRKRLGPDGKVASVEPFLTGFLQDNKYVGRPVDVLVAQDGALLVSDDYNGAIYRVSAAK